jgi:hypothetical protein
MTAFVTLCDRNYYPRALRTIRDLRMVWDGDIVLITIGFQADESDLNIIVKSFDNVPMNLPKIWETHPIRRMDDERHTRKLCQFNKLHVFDPYFKQWNRVVFVDAGMRVFNVKHLLELECTGIMAPDDSTPYDNGNRFGAQIDLNANPEINKKIEHFLNREIADVGSSNYFMNCIWMYNTSILDIVSSDEMIKGIDEFPICLTNEMALMNLYLNFKYNLWQVMPERVDSKYLYGWCELNYRERPDYHQFCFLKYPVSISIDNDP